MVMGNHLEQLVHYLDRLVNQILVNESAMSLLWHLRLSLGSLGRLTLMYVDHEDLSILF